MKLIYNFYSAKLLLFIAMVTFFNSDLHAQTFFSSGFETADPVFIYSSTTNTAARLTTSPMTGTYRGGFSAGGDADGSIITGTALTFTACRQYTFTVYAQPVNCYGFNLQIIKATTATNTAMNAAMGSDILLSTSLASPNTGYTAYSVTYIPTVTETKYIGFQMNYSGASGGCGSMSIRIDDISITETILPVPVGGTATPTAGSVACAGSTTITLTGSAGAIQWQSSTDGGVSWSNISGATSTTLSTGALYSSVQYRAFLQGAACATATSTVASVTNTGAATATWNTAGTTAWALASNWNAGAGPVPGACTDVTIPSGGTQPTISTVNASCHNLTVNAGATLTNSSSTFNIYGNLLNNGNINDGAGYTNLYGTNNTWGGTGTYMNGATQNGWICFMDDCNYSLINDIQPVKYIGGATITTSTNGSLSLRSFTLPVVTSMYNIFYLHYNTGMIDLRGGGSVNISKSDYDTGTLWINSSVNGFNFNLDDDYYNVWFSNSAGSTKFGSSAKDVQISNNLWNRGPGTLDMSSAGANAVAVGGDFTNDATFSASTCVIVMNGSKAQFINGSSVTTFNKLQINNSTSFGVTLQQNANSTGANTGAPTSADPYRNKGGLDLLNGPFFLNTKTFTIQNASTVSLTRTNGYAVSEMNAAINTSIIQWDMGATNGTYVIPFGLNGNYIPFTFAKTAGNSNMQFSTRATVSNDNLPLAGVSSVAAVTNMNSAWLSGADGSIPSVIDRWWDITALSGPSSVTANLTFSYLGTENTTTLAPTGTFGAQHWNGSAWDSQVGTGTGVTSGTGTVTVTGANTFSPWVLSSASAPLPIELLTFNAQFNMNAVDVSWTTATETNNDFFTIEKSQDAQNFEKVLNVDGAGNSSSSIDYFDKDYEPYVGISYYRLKQTDFNGKSSYSNIVPVENNPNGDPSISLFPNPTDAGTTTYIYLNQFEGQEVLVVLRDIAGREIFSKVLISTSNNELIALDQEAALAKGSYLVTATSANKFYNKKLIVK